MKNQFAKTVMLITITILVLSGCLGQTRQEYAKVEIYAAQSDTLIKSIDDSKILKEIRKNVTMRESDLYTAIESIPDSQVPEYYFVFYTKPTANSVNSEPKKNFTLTIYKDSDFIFDEFSETSISPDDVIYRSSKVVQYLRGLPDDEI